MFPFKKDPQKAPNLRTYPIGWYGDNGLGDLFIKKIIDGRKKATVRPAYDPNERPVGECFKVVDKNGHQKCVIRITAVEFLKWSQLTQEHAAMLDLTLEEIAAYLPKFLSRALRPDEELRITYFELV